MKKVNQNHQEKFEDSVAGLEVKITKTVQNGNVSFYASVQRGEKETASVSYDRKGSYLIVRLSEPDSFTEEERKALLDAAGNWTKELTAEG